MLENGIKFSIISNTNEAQKFYIGDVTYVMKDEVSKIWEEHNYEDGQYTIPASFSSFNKDTSFVACGTKYGDGCFDGQGTGFSYSVDGGVLGIIPADICNEDQYTDKLMKTVIGKKVEMFVDDDGNFEFYVDDQFFEFIATDEEIEDDDYEDEYKYDEENDWDNDRDYEDC